MSKRKPKARQIRVRLKNYEQAKKVFEYCFVNGVPAFWAFGSGTVLEVTVWNSRDVSDIRSYIRKLH